jgi:fructokinase
VIEEQPLGAQPANGGPESGPTSRDNAAKKPFAKYWVAGLGEVLWDVFPQGRQLGGAPANFAYIATVLGDHGIVASRLGDDDLGAEAFLQLRARSLDCSYIQRDSEHATGIVKVSVNADGHPSFEIAKSAAWDSLTWTEEWKALAAKVDAVCFGSLAQRSAKSRSTIRTFLQNTRPEAVRVFDVNLRQQYYSAEVLSNSCRLANVVKMNGEELPIVLEVLGLPRAEIGVSARNLRAAYGLEIVCVTQGDKGSMLVAKESSHVHSGTRVQVVDTVGAGDAFTAGFVHEYLRLRTSQSGQPVDRWLGRLNDTANRMGAWVASRAGGMPQN